MTKMLERAARAAALANEDEGCFDAVSAYTPIARAVLMAVRMENGSDLAPLMWLEDSIAMDFLASDFTSVIDAILEGK